MTDLTDDTSEDPSSDEPAQKSRRGSEDPVAREMRLAKEAKALQASLNDGIVSDLKTRVAWILNLFPHTRNSDVALTIKYWEMFQRDIFNPVSMSPRDLFKLERESYIVRQRAKIQNEYKLFPADAEVRCNRRSRETELKDAAVEDKPYGDIVFVFADETGKNADYVCVAAVWVLTGYHLFKVSDAIRDWQATSPWANGEIHFSEFKKHHRMALAEYLELIKKNREFLSFKVIAVERAGLGRPIAEVVRRLHEFMIVRGAEHEVANHRISLPHTIRLTVDAEQSLDAISCADIRNRISDAFKVAHGDQLTMDKVSAIESHKSEMVQLADVVAGAINRRRNHKGERGHKDDMAELIVKELELQLEENEIPGVDASVWLNV